MSNFKEVVLPIVEEVNVKAFQIAGYLSLLGIIVLGCSVGFMEIGTFRTIGVVIALIFMVSPFALRFVIDKHKKIGIIRFSEGEILTKLKDQEPKIYEVNSIDKIEFNIVDHEGETKAKDLVRTSTRMNVRTGAENTVYWKFKDEDFHFKFKLENELGKRKALYFLKKFDEIINK